MKLLDTVILIIASCAAADPSLSHPPTRHLSHTYPQDCFQAQVEAVTSRGRASGMKKSLELVQQTVEDTLRNVWPECSVKLFGSHYTGLASPASDVDLTVFLPQRNNGTNLQLDRASVQPDQDSVLLQYNIHLDSNCIQVGRDTVPIDREGLQLNRDIVQLAHSTFQSSPSIYGHVRTRSRLPAITFTFRPLDVVCDVNFKIEGSFESELLHYLLSIDPRAAELAAIVKRWAKMRKLIHPKHLTSYGMMMLVVFYLQQILILPSVFQLQEKRRTTILCETNYFNVAFEKLSFVSLNNQSLYQILGGFFVFYESFDFANFVISPYTGRVVKKRLFKDVLSLPHEFSLYKSNVINNLTKPLNVTAVCVQSLLVLNDNCAWRVSSEYSFVEHFRIAAQHFRTQNMCKFLKAINIY